MTTLARTASRATRMFDLIGNWLESTRHQAIAALVLYMAIAIGYLGLHVLPHLGTVCVCEPAGTDPSIFMWSLAWWPHAVLHGLNPFLTHAVFAPDRVDVGGATTVPGSKTLSHQIRERSSRDQGPHRSG